MIMPNKTCVPPAAAGRRNSRGLATGCMYALAFFGLGALAGLMVPDTPAAPPPPQVLRIEAQRIELMGTVYTSVQVPPIALPPYPPYPPSPPVLVYPEVVIDDLPDAIKDRLMSPHQVSVTAPAPNVEIKWPERMIFELTEPREELERKFGKTAPPPADVTPPPAPAFRASVPQEGK